MYGIQRITGHTVRPVVPVRFARLHTLSEAERQMTLYQYRQARGVSFQELMKAFEGVIPLPGLVLHEIGLKQWYSDHNVPFKNRYASALGISLDDYNILWQNTLQSPTFFIPNRVATLRVDKGLKQKTLARLAGIKTTTLNDFENGLRVPAENKLLALAKALEVPPGELYSVQIPRGKRQKPFPNRLDELRIQAGYTTAKAFANAAGLHAEVVTRMENGHVPKLEHLLRIASTLGIAPWELLYQDEAGS